MTSSIDAPPQPASQPRPAWVTELNAVGANLGSPTALVALDEKSLLAAAIEATGGLEDFGGDAGGRGSASSSTT